MNVTQKTENEQTGVLTLITLLSCVSCHTLAAEGAPLAVTAAMVATGREAHVDTAAVRSQAAWRAGLGFSWAPQIIQLRRGDRGRMGDWTLWGSQKLPLDVQHFFFILPECCSLVLFKENHFLLSYFIQFNIAALESVRAHREEQEQKQD